MLALPALIYIFYVSFAENTYKKLPVFGPKEALSFVKGGKTDTLYHQLHPMQELLAENRHKLMVLSIFPDKDAVNTRLRYKQLARVEDVFKKNPLVWLVNVSWQEDSLAADTKTTFARKIERNQTDATWNEALRARLYPLEADWLAQHKKARLEELTFLVDQHFRVRGIYRTLVSKETDRLMEDVRTLIVEYANTEPKRR